MSFEGVVRQLQRVQQRIDSVADSVSEVGGSIPPSPFGSDIIQYGNEATAAGTASIVFPEEFNIQPHVFISVMDSNPTGVTATITNLTSEGCDVVVMDVDGVAPVAAVVNWMAIGLPLQEE